MRNTRLASAMMQCIVGDKAGNLERVRRLAARAAREGVDFLVLPEACLTGYTVRESMTAWAETIPGQLTTDLAGIAHEYQLFISAGLVECSGDDGCYLTQVLAGPEGLIGRYRKTHLGPTEKTWFNHGDALGLFNARETIYGIQLCYEGHFPEISQAQALRGADVLLIPHASPRESPDRKLERWLRYLPARAYDNTVFLAACNQAGDNGAGLFFAGIALIIGPKGDILAQAAGETNALVVANLADDELKVIREGRMGYFLPLRRPELYGRK
jgi:predicted amidohydrolase